MQLPEPILPDEAPPRVIASRISAIELVTEIMRLAKKYPNAVYTPPKKGSNGCSYFEGVVNDGPQQCGCIFGQAVRNLQPDLEEALRSFENRHAGWLFQCFCVDAGFWEQMTQCVDPFNLKDVQQKQDIRQRWAVVALALDLRPLDHLRVQLPLLVERMNASPRKPLFDGDDPNRNVGDNA